MTGHKDAFHLVYISHLLIGISVFLLWKTFITPYDYFTAIFPSFHFEFWFAAFYWVPAVPALILMVKFGERFSLSLRIITSLCVYLLVIVSVPLIQHFLLSSNPQAALWIILSEVMIGGFFSGIFFASSFGFAAHFPPIYTQAILTGNALAGILMIVIRIATKSSLPNEASADVYFGGSMTILLMTMIVYLLVIRTPFARHHFNALEDTDTKPLVGSSPEDSWEESNAPREASFKEVFSKVWKYAGLNLIAFTTTASLWPGLVTAIHPLHGDSMQGWFQLILIICFNVGDVIGRWMSGPFASYYPKQYLWIPIVIRAICFFPLIIIQVNPFVVPSNYFGYALALLLPLTGGYFGGCCMVHGPQEVKTHERQLAATIMTFSLNGGIFLGSLLAILLLWLVVGSVWTNAS